MKAKLRFFLTALPVPGQNRYIATITGVREVALLGLADLSFWQEQLRLSLLQPAPRDGKAQLILSAISARYMRVRFRELCVALPVERAEGTQHEGLFFVGAFNSSRLFTFFERNWFGTPYAHGQIELTTEPAAAIALLHGGRTLLHAAMAAEVPPGGAAWPAERDHAWAGAIHLPAARGGRTAGNRYFNALIAGRTHGRPFDAGRDRLLIERDTHDPVLRALIDSGFTGLEWSIRPNATHARSKTFHAGIAERQRQHGSASNVRGPCNA